MNPLAPVMATIIDINIAKGTSAADASVAIVLLVARPPSPQTAERALAEVLGLITARGGSKGLPRKAVADLGGRPLVAWTVDAAMRSRTLTRIVTSTDDLEIADAARHAGSEIPLLRPAHLATDDSAHILTVEHTLDWLHVDRAYSPDYVVLLQPTSPLRSPDDIDAAVTLAVETRADAVCGVCVASPHPQRAMTLGADGTLSHFVGLARTADPRRQDLEPAFAPNGAIFVNRRSALLRDRTFVPPGTRAYVMPPDRSIDVDTPWDLELARLIVAGRRAHD